MDHSTNHLLFLEKCLIRLLLLSTALACAPGFAELPQPVQTVRVAPIAQTASLPQEVGFDLAGRVAQAQTTHASIPCFAEPGRLIWGMNGREFSLEFFDRGVFAPHFAIDGKTVVLGKEFAADFLLNTVKYSVSIQSEHSKAALMLAMNHLGTDDGLKALAHVLYGNQPSLANSNQSTNQFEALSAHPMMRAGDPTTDLCHCIEMCKNTGASPDACAAACAKIIAGN